MNVMRWIDLGETIVGALQAIEKITHVGGPKADEALAAIKAVLEALEDGFKGDSTPHEVLARIDALHASLKSNDESADADLARKFDVGGEG